MGSPTRTPRLLVITPDFPPVPGGIQLLTYHLAIGLRGFDTRVLALDGPGAKDFDAHSGLATRRVAIDRRLGLARMAALDASALREAWRFRPDVVLVAHIVASPAAAVIRRVLRTRTVQYFHANEIGDKPKLAAFAARRADVAVAVSAYTAGLVAATGASAADLRVIPPGVDLPDDPTPRRRGRPTVLTIARLRDAYKGHDVLIRALALVRAEVPDVELVVIGDGQLRGKLERLASSAGVSDAVSFLGTVSDEQRDEWLRSADVFAMPSRLPSDGRAGEGFGIVYLEAAAYGKPVVAGNVAGALDAVLDGETGLLVDPTDERAVADALVRLLVDRALAERLGGAGAERAKGFAWQSVAARLEALLCEQVVEKGAVDRTEA